MKTVLPTAAVVLGAALLLMSFCWALLFPPSQVWTQEKSARMAELGGQGHLLKFQLIEAKANPNMHGKKSAAELQAEFDKIDAEYKLLSDEFQGAKDSPKTAATYLRWSGVAFVIAGAIVVFASRDGG